MVNKTNQHPLTILSGKNVLWNNNKPNIGNPVNANEPPQYHCGYVVIQDSKIVGPCYRYYETASENAGSGIVTSFNLAVKEKWA